MQIKRRGGFTLAELLIVMAIIVVLAAVAIPTFGKQLETARETADAEVLRAALTDVFTKAYVDYANDGAWTHANANNTTAAATTFQTVVNVAPGNGAYMVELADLAPMSQATAGFEYISPKFLVGSSSTTTPLTESSTVKIAKSTATAPSGVSLADAIVFVFSPGAAGAESEIQLVSVTAVEKS